MWLISKSTEIGIDIRNQFIDKNCLKWFDLEISDTTYLCIVGHSISHHNNEGFDLAFGDHVVHDQIGMSLVTPGSFILAPTMLKIKHWVTSFLIFVVTRRGVNKCPTRCACAFGGEKYLLYITMRNILQ